MESFKISVIIEASQKVLFERVINQPQGLLFPFDSVFAALSYLFKDIPHIIQIQKSIYSSKD